MMTVDPKTDKSEIDRHKSVQRAEPFSSHLRQRSLNMHKNGMKYSFHIEKSWMTCLKNAILSLDAEDLAIFVC